MQVPNKMVGNEGDSRALSGSNSPVNDMAMAKKRRMNWDDVQGGTHNENNAIPNLGLVKDTIQMDRRKMGKQ